MDIRGDNMSVSNISANILSEITDVDEPEKKTRYAINELYQ